MRLGVSEWSGRPAHPLWTALTIPAGGAASVRLNRTPKEKAATPGRRLLLSPE